MVAMIQLVGKTAKSETAVPIFVNMKPLDILTRCQDVDLLVWRFQLGKKAAKPEPTVLRQHFNFCEHETIGYFYFNKELGCGGDGGGCTARQEGSQARHCCSG